jgi:hypothetical protein
VSQASERDYVRELRLSFKKNLFGWDNRAETRQVFSMMNLPKMAVLLAKQAEKGLKMGQKRAKTGQN